MKSVDKIISNVKRLRAYGGPLFLVLQINLFSTLSNAAVICAAKMVDRRSSDLQLYQMQSLKVSGKYRSAVSVKV